MEPDMIHGGRPHAGLRDPSGSGQIKAGGIKAGLVMLRKRDREDSKPCWGTIGLYLHERLLSTILIFAASEQVDIQDCQPSGGGVC